MHCVDQNSQWTSRAVEGSIITDVGGSVIDVTIVLEESVSIWMEVGGRMEEGEVVSSITLVGEVELTMEIGDVEIVNVVEELEVTGIENVVKVVKMINVVETVELLETDDVVVVEVVEVVEVIEVNTHSSKVENDVVQSTLSALF